jgi:drug/metabolite transporter (DMT)-like permease
MIQNKNAKGIIFITFGMFVFAIQDSITKYIYEDIALYEMYFIRSFISFFIIILYLKITNKAIVFKTHYPILTLIRVFLFFFGFSSFYISLTIMPLATANSLFFCSPFIITILARFFLKEEVGFQRWAAVIVGFVGVYIILNPNYSNFDYLTLLPIICAFCYAISMIIIRKTSEKDNVYSQILQFYITGMLISLIFYFFAGDGQYNTINHPASQFIFRKWFSNLEFSLPYMVIIGVVAAGAFLSIFTAYRIASPSVISPFEYTILIWAALSGWLIFGEIPDERTFVGIFLVIAGGIYIFIRESIKDQTVVTEKPLR